MSLAFAGAAGCDGADRSRDGAAERTSAGAPGDRDPFVDVTEASGLRFVHDNGFSGRYYMPEIMGSGVALLDANGDGVLDVYLVQGGPLEEPSRAGGDRLFLGRLETDAGGATRPRYEDATAAAGLVDAEHGMGVAAGDVDGDGDVDLYVTNFGRNRLWRNDGTGFFEDVTLSAGAGDDRWSVPAVFFDKDADGDLDLFVGNYVEFRLANHKDCFSPTGLADYCGPHSYNEVPDRLLENRGDGTFVDVTARSGLRRAGSKALGALPFDVDGDGRLDLYVANDGVANQLWINGGDGTFTDEALLAGCALSGEGLAEASMGVDAADVDGDGDGDLFMTHLKGETNTLYLNRGDGTFEDRTIRLGLAAPSVPLTGFGTAWIDVDNDGRLDLLAVNGAVTVEERLVREGDPFPFHQRNQMFWNVSTGDAVRFREHVASPGGPFAVSEVSRGAAFGDLDNDGDTDVVVSNNGGPARVLLNVAGQDAAWIGLRLLLAAGGPDAVGALAAVEPTGGARLVRQVRTAGSYASANDPRVLFGLGDRDPAGGIAVEVTWTDGSRESFGPLAVRRYHELVRGTGTPAEPGP